MAGWLRKVVGWVRGFGPSPFMSRRDGIPWDKGEVGISRDLAAVVWRLSRLLSGFIREMGLATCPAENETHPHPDRSAGFA
jgi:hypothetical protein